MFARAYMGRKSRAKPFERFGPQPTHSAKIPWNHETQTLFGHLKKFNFSG